MSKFDTQRIKVRPVQVSPVGLYLVPAPLSREALSEIRRQMYARGVQGLIVPLMPGESIEAVSIEAARKIRDQLTAAIERHEAASAGPAVE